MLNFQTVLETNIRIPESDFDAHLPPLLLA